MYAHSVDRIILIPGINQLRTKLANIYKEEKLKRDKKKIIIVEDIVEKKNFFRVKKA